LRVADLGWRAAGSLAAAKFVQQLTHRRGLPSIALGNRFEQHPLGLFVALEGFVG
jgi:hypothetical protein